MAAEIRLEHICKAYGSKQALRDLSCTFPIGSAACILGPSGCGKTTLLRLIAGLEAPDSGCIRGVEAQKISAVFQENRLIENLSAEKNVLLTASRGFGRADALQLLQELGIAENARKPVCKFSGGMKRRAALARALAAEFDLLLLDEPFTGLDEASKRQAMDVLLRRAAGRTLICVTHDPQDAPRMNASILYI